MMSLKATVQFVALSLGDGQLLRRRGNRIPDVFHQLDAFSNTEAFDIGDHRRVLSSTVGTHPYCIIHLGTHTSTELLTYGRRTRGMRFSRAGSLRPRWKTLYSQKETASPCSLRSLVQHCSMRLQS